MNFTKKFGKMLEVTPEKLELSSFNRDEIRELLIQHKLLLFRGFDVNSERFCEFSDGLGQNFRNYQGGSFQRKAIGKKQTLLSVTGDGQTFGVPLHGEMYYTKRRPGLLWFYCEAAPREGGETTVCDAAEFYQSLSEETRNLLQEKEIVYIRNYKQKEWQGIYQTNDIADVEKACADNEMEITVQQDGGIQTRFATNAVVHTCDGKPLFINNIIPVLMQEREWKRDNSIVRFTDNSEIPVSIYNELLNISAEISVNLSWQDGDIVLVDNTTLMHGRNPITDTRRSIMVRLSDKP